jgi:pimeloyl-ACP methyl ester carboxylesterase
MKVKLGDIETAYSVQGEGPPVVLIHGLAEGKESWRGIQEKLSDFKTFTYDLRGHGKSSLGKGAGTLEQLGGDLIAFLEKVSGPAQCVGYSLGGTIVLCAAAKRPDLFTGIIVAGTSTVVGNQAVEFFKERIRMIQNDVSVLTPFFSQENTKKHKKNPPLSAQICGQNLEFAPALRNDTALQIVNSGVDLEAVVANRLEAVGNGCGYVNAARAMMRLHEIPLTPLLTKIQSPVSVIGGEKDIFCPRKAGDIMLSKLNKGTFYEVANAGHLMSVDQPETYTNAIRSGLQRKH